MSNPYLEPVVLENNGNIGVDAFSFCENLRSVSIDCVGAIGGSAFHACGIEDLHLGDKITDIGPYAFKKCSNLTSLTVPNSAANLCIGCFQNCKSLSQFVIGNSVQRIEDAVFSGCQKLSEIVIPNSVKTIGNNVFAGCSGLANVIVCDRSDSLALGHNSGIYVNLFNPLFSECPLDSVYIGGKITYNTSADYGFSPFYRNKTLRSVVVTDNEEEIRDNEFYGCTGLKRVEVGDGVKRIGNWAFSGCSSLESFTIGKSIETIGQEAFSDCSSMTKLSSHAPVPPTCGSQALDDINKWECTLYVPGTSIEEYKTAAQWRDFFFVKDNKEDLTDTVEPLSFVKDQNNDEIYNLSGQRMQTHSTKGIYIVNGKKKVIR